MAEHSAKTINYRAQSSLVLQNATQLYCIAQKGRGIDTNEKNLPYKGVTTQLFINTYL